MKKSISYLAMSVMALFLAVAISSCSSSPVSKYCDELGKLTAQVSKAQSESEIDEIIESMDNIKLTDAEKDYRLTDADKEALKKSTDDFFNAIAKKAEDLGQGQVAIGIAFVSGIVNGAIDQSDTLGDLEKNLESF